MGSCLWLASFGPFHRPKKGNKKCGKKRERASPRIPSLPRSRNKWKGSFPHIPEVRPCREKDPEWMPIATPNESWKAPKEKGRRKKKKRGGRKIGRWALSLERGSQLPSHMELGVLPRELVSFWLNTSHIAAACRKTQGGNCENHSGLHVAILKFRGLQK